MAIKYVDPDNGSDSNNGSTMLLAYATVTKAIEVIGGSGASTIILANSENHTIRVGDLGHGNENRMRSPLTFQNEDDDTDYTKVIISGTDEVRLVVTDQNEQFVFKGLTFKDRNFTAGTRSLLNFAGRTGTSLTLNGVKFDGITSSVSNYGGILEATGNSNTLSMTDVVVTNCYHSNAGFVFNVNGWNTTIDGCTVQNCGDGSTTIGRWKIHNTTAATDVTCDIENLNVSNVNSAGDGGWCYFYVDGTANAGSLLTVDIKSSSFTDCGVGAEKGGAFWFGLDVLGYCEGTTFTRCVCDAYGGGASGHGANTVQATNQPAYFTGCTFIECVSDTDGGALKCDPGAYLVISNCTFIDCLGLEGDAVWIGTKNITHDATLSTIQNCIISGTASGFHLFGNADAAIGLIKDTIIDGGSAKISDSGATQTNVTTFVSGDVNSDGSIPVDSNAIGRGAKWWTGVNPVGSDGEPFSDFDTDIGGFQSTHGPFHPVNL